MNNDQRLVEVQQVLLHDLTTFSIRMKHPMSAVR